MIVRELLTRIGFTVDKKGASRSIRKARSKGKRPLLV
jgi:hypothetical protein